MSTNLRKFVSVVSGIVFGLGLGFSQMIDRERVLGFLDFAGSWDPTLLFVLGGAVGTTMVAFRFVLKRKAPLFADSFARSTNTRIDSSLIIGSAIFGIGWGIAGYCPGPGIAALIFAGWTPVIFVSAFAAGTLLASIRNDQ